MANMVNMLQNPLRLQNQILPEPWGIYSEPYKDLDRHLTRTWITISRPVYFRHLV